MSLKRETTSFLLCPPDYYGVEYEINPWMCRIIKPVPDFVERQWTLLDTTLHGLGVILMRLSPVSGLPDMVFTANAGLVVGKQFISSRFRFEVRQGETPHHQKWFQDRGYQIITPPADICFEGEGDALWVGETLFLGCGIRTDPSAQSWLNEVLNRPVIALELVDPRFYHLDTCFCPLDDQRVLYYPPAFSPVAQGLIQSIIPCPIPMKEEDAVAFGANAIVVNKHVVLNGSSATLTKTLMDEGFDVHSLDFREFIKAGGSAKCLVLRLA